MFQLIVYDVHGVRNKDIYIYITFITKVEVFRHGMTIGTVHFMENTDLL